LKFFEIFEILKFLGNFEILYAILEFFLNFKIFENFDLFCNLIGRLEMKSRLWLDKVETPNRQ
jgi:hypothetical protein